MLIFLTLHYADQVAYLIYLSDVTSPKPSSNKIKLVSNVCAGLCRKYFCAPIIFEILVKVSRGYEKSTSLPPNSRSETQLVSINCATFVLSNFHLYSFCLKTITEILKFREQLQCVQTCEDLRETLDLCYCQQRLSYKALS